MDAQDGTGLRRESLRLRQAKVVAAAAFSVLAGVGAYTVTYRTLVLVSQPSAAAPVAPQSPRPGPLHTTTPPAVNPAP